MRFDRLRKGLLPKRAKPATSDLHSATSITWRAERSGSFGGYSVSGWRYIDLAIWHVTVSLVSDGKPGKRYVISAGEFYPNSVSRVEKFAALRLIAFWEADGFG
jgi:hypothetical protein